MSKPTAVVVGVGAEQGVGAAVCRRFAREGYHVLVAGRTPGQDRAGRRAASSRPAAAPKPSPPMPRAKAEVIAPVRSRHGARQRARARRRRRVQRRQQPDDRLPRGHARSCSRTSGASAASPAFSSGARRPAGSVPSAAAR